MEPMRHLPGRAQVTNPRSSIAEQQCAQPNSSDRHSHDSLISSDRRRNAERKASMADSCCCCSEVAPADSFKGQHQQSASPNRRKKLVESPAVKTLVSLLQRVRDNDPTLIRVSSMQQQRNNRRSRRPLPPMEYMESLLSALSSNSYVRTLQLQQYKSKKTCNSAATKRDSFQELIAKADSPRLATAIAGCLSQNHSLVRLDFRGLDLDGQILAQAFQSNSCLKLKKLSLQGTMFGRGGLEALLDAIPNTRISSLVFGNNESDWATISAWRALAILLSSPDCTLEYLDLRGTGLGTICAVGEDETAVDVLVKALKQNTSLKNLHLGRNHLSNSDLFNLCSALRQNTGLKTLNLSYNNDLSGISDVISILLSENNTMSNIYLEGTNVTFHDRHMLEIALRLNLNGSELAKCTKEAMKELQSSDLDEQTFMHHSVGRIDEDEDSRFCVVCYDPLDDASASPAMSSNCTILLPCLHDHCCRDCSLRLKRCPLCRCTIVTTYADVIGVFRIFSMLQKFKIQFFEVSIEEHQTTC